MGLIKSEIKKRSIARLINFMSKYGDRITSTTKYKLSNFSESLPEEEHVIISKWDKNPICAHDICVFSAVMFDDNDNTIIFCDYDAKNDKIESSYKHTRAANDLDYHYIDRALMRMEAKEDVESTVPVRKKPQLKYVNMKK